ACSPPRRLEPRKPLPAAFPPWQPQPGQPERRPERPGPQTALRRWLKQAFYEVGNGRFGETAAEFRPLRFQNHADFGAQGLGRAARHAQAPSSPSNPLTRLLLHTLTSSLSWP